MLAISSILLLLLSIHVTSCLSLMTRNVYILPSEGENCPGHSCYNISTFGTMADSFSDSSGLVAHFLEGTHLLDELVVFTNLTNAVFEGEGRMEQGFHETVQQSTVVIKCTQHSGGIAFVVGFNITFKYLTITNCGVRMQSLVHENLKTSSYSFNATLGFFYAGDVTVDHVSLQNWSSGNGLFIVVDRFDLIVINSSFTRYITKFENVLGGNVLVIYTDPCDCVHQSDSYNALIAKTNVTSFGSNEFQYMISANGGILVGFTQRTYRVQLTLDSVVAYGIRGLSSIAVFTTMAELPNYKLTINNTNSSYGYGFGLLIDTGLVFTFLGSSKCSTNLTYFDHDLIIFIDNSVFAYNKYKTTSFDCLIKIVFFNIQYSPTIKIQSTEISNNVDYSYGLCISLSAYQGELFGNISNVVVKNNSCTYQLPKAQTPNFQQHSAIYVYFVTSLRLKNVTIAHNNMTGLAVHRTNILVCGNASVIHNNTGINGGGLALYGDSYLLLEDDSHLTFTNNIAQRGGAIFVDAAGFTLLIVCFFQFPGLTQSQSAKVSFSNNKAAIAGSVVYGARGNDCLLYTSNNTNTTNTVCGQLCFNKTFKYSAQTGLSILSSDPYDVCFCTNNTPSCSNVDGTLYINAYCGEKVNISLVSVGWNNGVVPGTVQMQQLGNLSAESVVFNTTAMSCAIISFTVLHSKYSLKILGTSSSFGSFISSKVLYISLSKCPLGFQTSKHTDSCDCDELKENISLPGTLTCDASTKTMTRQGDVWIGNISECVVVHNTCPFDYCNSSQVTFTLADPSPQCALNRTGILCGECKEGLSLVLGSDNCIECPAGFSYIAFILLYAAAGFGLVILLLILNLTVSVGTINGLLFYANIIQVNSSIFKLRKTVPLLSQFIAWLNLDLGIDTCFYNGMTAYKKVWLQFVFPLYIWFIIATIIILCRYSKWLPNKIGGNVVQVLATLILLSFTKIFRTIVLALKFTTLSCVYSDSSVLVWNADGSIYYLKWPHILLFLFALVFLLLALPYAIGLLFESPIERYLTKIECFRRNWLKVKPLVDAYNGPYKDNCRFWTGLLILVRMVFTAAAVNTGNTIIIFTTTVVLVLIGTIGAFGGIYQKKHLDVLECWSLINLGVIPCSSASNAMNENIVGRISEGLMLITFIGIITYHVFLCFPISKCFRKCFKEKKDSDENEPLLNQDKDCVIRQLPTHSEFYLDREPLLNEYN